MKVLSMVAILIMTTSAFADRGFNNGKKREIRQIKRLANQILNEVDYSIISHEEMKEAKEYLRIAKRIIFAQADDTNDMPTGNRMSQFECTSKYNNNHAPYQLSYYDENFNLVVVKGATFANIESCLDVKNETLSLSQADYFCKTKYDNGNNPYVIAKYDNLEITKDNTISFTSEEQCKELLFAKPARSGYIAMSCVPKYNNGHPPYNIAFFDLSSGEITQKKDTTFTSKEACQSVVNSRM